MLRLEIGLYDEGNCGSSVDFLCLFLEKPGWHGIKTTLLARKRTD